MQVCRFYDGRWYTLTNDNLAAGDMVYPISYGQVVDGVYVHADYKFGVAISGFPAADDTKYPVTGLPGEPHKIIDLHYSKDKAYEVRTDKGFGPREIYYKIIDVMEDTHDETQETLGTIPVHGTRGDTGCSGGY